MRALLAPPPHTHTAATTEPPPPASQVYADEYDLILQPDINTRGHTQWYYFSVSNTRAGRPYKFNIINLLKEESLYNMGMLPLVHSELAYKAKVHGMQSGGWLEENASVGAVLSKGGVMSRGPSCQSLYVPAAHAPCTAGAGLAALRQ